ncbi:MAG: PqqD family protein [Clostridia bacterium]|nr:PqqD family protein [Clostridia bacterium]
MLKVREGFLLRKMMQAHVVVAVGEAGRDFNGMIRLNDIGAWLWQEMQRGIEHDELLDKMLQRYDELTRAEAEADLDAFLQTVSFALEGEQ